MIGTLLTKQILVPLISAGAVLGGGYFLVKQNINLRAELERSEKRIEVTEISRSIDNAIENLDEDDRNNRLDELLRRDD